MNEMFVGKLWMVGMLFMMCLFGVFALIGYVRAKRAGILDEYR